MENYTTYKIGENRQSITRNTCLIEGSEKCRVEILEKIIKDSGIPLKDTLFINVNTELVKRLGIQSIDKTDVSLFDWYSLPEGNYLDTRLRADILSKVYTRILSLVVGEGVYQTTFKNYVDKLAKVVYTNKECDLLDLIHVIIDREIATEYIDRLPDILIKGYREEVTYLRDLMDTIDSNKFIVACIKTVEEAYSELSKCSAGDRIDLTSIGTGLNINIKGKGKDVVKDYIYIFNKLYVYNTAKIVLKQRYPIMVVINDVDKIEDADIELIRLLMSSILYRMKLVFTCSGIDRLGYKKHLFNSAYMEYVVNNYYIDDIESIKGMGGYSET